MIFLFSFLFSFIKVLCVGDSLTSDGGYTSYLANYIGNNGTVTVNAKRGIRSKVVTDRLKVVLNRGVYPTHVVWYAGINDCLSEGTIGVHGMSDVVKKSMHDAVKMSEKHIFYLVLVKHHPWLGSNYCNNNKAWKCSLSVNNYIESIGKEHDNIIVIETHDLGDEASGLLGKYDSGDGLHLNHIGYKALAKMIYFGIINNDR